MFSGALASRTILRRAEMFRRGITSRQTRNQRSASENSGISPDYASESGQWGFDASDRVVTKGYSSFRLSLIIERPEHNCYASSIVATPTSVVNAQLRWFLEGLIHGIIEPKQDCKVVRLLG
jgi:hypothetical protein